jgi:hypothetical protein
MPHGQHDFGRQVIDGVDLMIDFATLGEYGLEPRAAVGRCRERPGRRPRAGRRPGWEASATARRGACAADGPGDVAWRFPRSASPRADFRAALDRYAT